MSVSTIPVAVFLVTKYLDSIERADEDAPRHQYAGQLLARAYPGMAPVPLTNTAPGQLRARVEQVMTSRITVSNGGPIGYLEPNLSKHRTDEPRYRDEQAQHDRSGQVIAILCDLPPFSRPWQA